MKKNYSMTGIIVAALLHALLFGCMLTMKSSTTAQADNTVRLLFEEKKEIVEVLEEESIEIPDEIKEEVAEQVEVPVVLEEDVVEPEYDFVQPERAVAANVDFENVEKEENTAERMVENIPAAPGNAIEENGNISTEGHEQYAAVDMVAGGISPSICGNGIKEKGEECDDGNRIQYDGCSPGCRMEDEERNHKELYAEYGKLLRGYISKYTRYPERARRKKLEGVAIVTFDIYRDGKVQNIQVEKSSGYSVLDYEALEAIRYPERMPAPPETLLRFGEPIMGKMTFNFNLENVTFEDYTNN